MKNRLLLLACFLVAATCPPAQTPAQPPEATVYTSDQFMPFLRLYDLKGLADLIHSKGTMEVPVSFNEHLFFQCALYNNARRR